MLRTTLMASCLALASLSASAEGDFDTEGGFAAFEKLFGVTEGKRRNHTKGFCVEGVLSPVDSAIKGYSNSQLFTGQSTVVGRVSHKGGKPNPADDKFGALGLAMEITTTDGDLHVIAANTEHFFPVATSEEFIELLRATAEGKAAAKAFAAKHPALKVYKEYHGALDKTLKPYEGTTFNSVNAFYLVDAAGKKSGMRFSFRPSGEEGIVTKTNPDFFLENMQTNIANGGVSWDMVVTLANPGDPIADPSAQWTGDHKEIIAARFTAEKAMAETDGRCDALNFDPMVLTEGFAPSEDPMLEVRSMIYALGVGKRLSEKE